MAQGPDAVARPIGGLRLPLVAAMAWLALVGLAAWLRPAGSAVTLCILRNVTGLPCPTCGSTRSVRALAAGRPIEALGHNPLMVSALACSAAWLLWRAVRAPRRRGVERRPSNGAALAVVAVMLAVANWCYLLAHDAAGGFAWR